MLRKITFSLKLLDTPYYKKNVIIVFVLFVVTTFWVAQLHGGSFSWLGFEPNAAQQAITPTTCCSHASFDHFCIVLGWLLTMLHMWASRMW
jgi:hypothetical protein